MAEIVAPGGCEHSAAPAFTEARSRHRLVGPELIADPGTAQGRSEADGGRLSECGAGRNPIPGGCVGLHAVMLANCELG
jgi:hypothetical protein